MKHKSYKKVKKSTSYDGPLVRYGGDYQDDVFVPGLLSTRMESRSERNARREEKIRVEKAYAELIDLKSQNYSDYVVKLRSCVSVKIDGETNNFFISESMDDVAPSGYKMITYNAPVARALIGHSIGETVIATVDDDKKGIHEVINISILSINN